MPLFSDCKLIIARYSLAVKSPKKDMSDEEGVDDESSTGRSKTPAIKYDITQIPDHAKIIVVGDSSSIESSFFKWIEKSAYIESFDVLSGVELRAKAKLLLPNIS